MLLSSRNVLVFMDHSSKSQAIVLALGLEELVLGLQVLVLVLKFQVLVLGLEVK